MTSKLQPLNPRAEDLGTTRAIAQRLRRVDAVRMEEVLAELPTIARRLGTLLLVVCISIPVFVVALVAILWHLAS
jgi:CHASE3 domain sensor protein